MIRSAAIAAACISLLSFYPVAAGNGYVHVAFDAGQGVSSAAFDYRKDVSVRDAEGIVVLVPGYNGDGTALLDDAAWTEYARRNGFILGALTLVSPEDDLKEGKGYYDTSAGSGDAVAKVLRKIGGGRLPVFMCGFSGGARFTAAFAESHPRSLRGWCAASFDDKNTARFSDDNSIKRRPPGIVACGAEDPRIGAARAYFGRGRVAGRQWTWLEVAGLGHGRSPVIDGFARAYFLALLDRRARGVWMDVGSRNDVAHSRDTAKELQTWLPDGDIAALWRDVSLRKEHGIVEHVEKVKRLKSYRQLTMFLRMPSSGRVKGVLCLCLLADNPMEVREKIRGDEDRRIEPVLFAERQDLAIIAWGSRCLWDPSSNWNELSRMRERGIDRDFDLAAEAWEAGVRYFERTCGLPSSGYLMSGFSGSAQYALRLAMRRPERFLAVHVHVPSSFDRPSRKASSVLWCLTTGENEMGYERSRAFFEAARGMGYPVVYKAYPGLGHAGDARATALGYACFEYALAEYGRVRKGRGNGSGKPDWESVFAGSDFVADIVNQQIFSAADADCIPPEFRISLPSEDIRAAWKTE